MKRTNLLLILAGICLIFQSNVFSQIDSTTLNSSSITTTVWLHSNTRYIMKGFNYVRNGGTLAIEPGTVILGDTTTKGTLIIERGGKLFADGTVNQPIVFTSRLEPGQRKTGNWGGIVVCGRSGINTVSGADSAEVEGWGPGLGPIYGGQPRIDDDSSGVIRYVRIEFSGINLSGISGNEINGLTLAGVGSRTIIDYVQVSYCGDDSYECFGGTVNLKHLIAFKGIDDDWDTDNGYRGKIQFGLSVRDSGIYDVSTSNGFESDNNANSPSNYNGPRTKPIYSNMTVVGPFITTNLNLNTLWGRGGHLRRNTLTSIYNSIIMGWRAGLRFDGSGVHNACTGDTMQHRYNVYAGNLRIADSAGGSFGATAWLQTSSFNNTFYATSSEVMLTNPYAVYPDPSGTSCSNWMPLAGSPVLTGADFSNPNLSGFEVVTYKGAFGTTNWTTGWSQWDPKNYQLPPIGIQLISSELPNRFELSQNYPNPFNPVTNINFSLPKSGFVTLKVFNMLGQEVASIVNGIQQAGTYKADFNANKLPSGVYFYTIKVVTNENSSSVWTDTKKMILIK